MRLEASCCELTHTWHRSGETAVDLQSRPGLGGLATPARCPRPGRARPSSALAAARRQHRRLPPRSRPAGRRSACARSWSSRRGRSSERLASSCRCRNGSGLWARLNARYNSRLGMRVMCVGNDVCGSQLQSCPRASRSLALYSDTLTLSHVAAAPVSASSTSR